jgi:hypothetical protein
MAVDARTFLEGWHAMVRARDAGQLDRFLADDVKLGAPPYWDPLEGRALVAHLLGIILNTVEDFTYHRQWVDGRELALEFKGHVGEHQLQGIDLITLDDSNRIARLDVVIRPLNTLERLRDIVAPQMMAYLSGQ